MNADEQAPPEDRSVPCHIPQEEVDKFYGDHVKYMAAEAMRGQDSRGGIHPEPRKRLAGASTYLTFRSAERQEQVARNMHATLNGMREQSDAMQEHSHTMLKHSRSMIRMTRAILVLVVFQCVLIVLQLIW